VSLPSLGTGVRREKIRPAPKLAGAGLKLSLGLSRRPEATGSARWL
jgi:hypothetical protein